MGILQTGFGIWNLLNKLLSEKEPQTKIDPDLPYKIAQNQIWGENAVASDRPYDEYSPFANPSTQTMGQRDMSYPNPGLPQRLIGFPKELDALNVRLQSDASIRQSSQDNPLFKAIMQYYMNNPNWMQRR